MKYLPLPLISAFCFFIVIFPLFAFDENPDALVKKETYKNVRNREQMREALLKERLHAENIPFTQVSLFEDYGAYGNSIYVYVPSSSGWENADSTDSQTDFSKQESAENSLNDENNTRLVLAVPISSVYDNDDDFHFGFQFALSCIKKALQEPPAVPFCVAFLADEWESINGAPAFAGFRALLDSLETDGNALVLYANLRAYAAKMSIVQASKQYTVPLALLEPFVNLCVKDDIEIDFLSDYNFLYKIGIAPDTEQLNMASESSIPILYLSAEEGIDSSPSFNEINADKLSGLVLEWAQTISNFHEKIIKDNIKKYTIFKFKNRIFIVQEKNIVFFTYIANLALLFISVLLYKHAEKQNKFFYLVLLLFFILNIVIALFIDIIFLLFLTESLIFLTLLYFLKFKTIELKKSFPLRNVIIISICILLAGTPYIDIAYNIARQIKLGKTPPSFSGSEFLETDFGESLFSLDVKDRLFLARRFINITLSAIGEPERFCLFFRPEEGSVNDIPSG
ncbi:MAG: hypothetical protein LBV68_00745, partial [Spirochaetaceae bacterium]|nr:hypothetical protein [Spirochaetaceae bacterium]